MGLKGLSNTLLVTTEASEQATSLARELRTGEERLRRAGEARQNGPDALLWDMVADCVPGAADWQAGEECLRRARGVRQNGPDALLWDMVTDGVPEAADWQADEERLRRAGDARQNSTSALLWDMVTDGVPEAVAWHTNESRIDVLCERALRLRGGLAGGPERLIMREKARILARISSDEHETPHTASDLLALWDEATRLEPVIRLRIAEPRWRTEDDALPFTTTPLSRFVGAEPLPLPPGKETADPVEIPTLVDALFAFLAVDSLDPVLTAVHIPHLIGRIHPFVDGNGHTGRLLMCDLLSRAGFGAPTLVAYIAVHHARAEHWAALMDAACLGQVGADELITFQLRMLAQAQADAMRTFSAR